MKKNFGIVLGDRDQVGVGSSLYIGEYDIERVYRRVIIMGIRRWICKLICKVRQKDWLMGQMWEDRDGFVKGDFMVVFFESVLFFSLQQNNNIYCRLSFYIITMVKDIKQFQVVKKEGI